MADFKIPGLGKKEDKPKTLQDAGDQTPIAGQDSDDEPIQQEVPSEPTVMQRLAEATRAIAAAQEALISA